MLNLNIFFLDKDLQFIISEVAEQLEFSFNEKGYKILGKKNAAEKLTISFDGDTFLIEYNALNQFARGLRLIKQHYQGKSFKVEEIFMLNELGMLLDCSSNAVRTVVHYKKIIRNLALLGYNQVYVSTDNTFEVPKEPYVGYLRGKYTIEEMREIDRYAEQFGLEAIHCFQTLAHQLLLLRWPVYYEITDIWDIMLVEDERTYQLIDNMFEALNTMFKSRKIHIGMDEAHYLGRGIYQDKHGSAVKRSDILLKHLSRVIEIAEKYGYEPMMWGDTFLHMLSADYNLSGDEVVPKEIMEKIPENIRLVYWDYYSKEYEHYSGNIKAYQGFKRELYFAGGAWMWTGFTPQNKYSFDCLVPAISACKDRSVKNFILTLWNDNGAECSDLAVLPVICLAAEKFYGHEEIDDAFLSLTGIELNDYLSLDLPSIVDFQAPSNCSNRSKYMLYNDCLYGIFDFIANDGDNQKYLEHAKKLEQVAKKAGRYRYLFETQKNLCDVLSVKYEIGVKTRKVYQKGNKEDIMSLLKESYYPLIKKIEKFYNSFKKQWDKENKQQGFEIQDYRLGGLIMRVKHCAERLKEYAEGKIAELPEIEEVILHSMQNLSSNGSFYDFRGMISASLI